jgi:NTP pyrophosphatase (non-canonical NTP hydrolase)
VIDEDEFALEELRENAEWSMLDDGLGDEHLVDALRAQMADDDPFEEAEAVLRTLALRPCREVSFVCYRNDNETWP